jgi:hypothetical protein
MNLFFSGEERTEYTGPPELSVAVRHNFQRSANASPAGSRGSEEIT